MSVDFTIKAQHDKFEFTLNLYQNKYTFFSCKNTNSLQEINIKLQDNTNINITKKPIGQNGNVYITIYDGILPKPLAGAVSPDLSDICSYVLDVIKATDSLPTKSPDKDPNSGKIIELSTAHLKLNTLDMMSQNVIDKTGSTGDYKTTIHKVQDAIDIYCQGDAGYFVRLVEKNFDDIPFSDLKECLEFAKDCSAKYILFDRDADIMPQLQTYEHYKTNLNKVTEFEKTNE